MREGLQNMNLKVAKAIARYPGAAKLDTLIEALRYFEKLKQEYGSNEFVDAQVHAIKHELNRRLH